METVNNILGSKKNALIQVQFKNSHGENISIPQVLANDFNEVFLVNIGPKLASKINSTGKEYREYLKDPIQNSVFLSPIIDEEIIKIITILDQTKSSGPGGYLVERWVRGCATQIGCFFGLSSLPMAPFLFENLDKGCVFAKYIIFN